MNKKTKSHNGQVVLARIRCEYCGREYLVFAFETEFLCDTACIDCCMLLETKGIRPVSERYSLGSVADLVGKKPSKGRRKP